MSAAARFFTSASVSFLTIPVDVTPATGRPPVGLRSVLIGHVVEEVPAHPIVEEVRLVPVLPGLDELVGQGVNEDAGGTATPLFHDRIMRQRRRRLPLAR